MDGHGSPHALDPAVAGFSRGSFLSFLLARGLVGLAWADSNLIVQGTSGRLASWIAEGQHIPSDLAPFQGLEDELRELMDDFRPSLVIPKIGLNIEGADAEKTSLEVFWFEPQDLFIIVLHRLGGQPEFEAELAQQMRARRLAEESLAVVQRAKQEARDLLDIIADRAPLGLAVFDDRLRYRFATQRWIEHLELTGQPVVSFEHQRLTGTDGKVFDEGLKRALRGHAVSGLSGAGEVLPQPKKESGALRGTVWSHTPWFDASGSIGGVVTAVHGVAALVDENARLHDRVRDLERMNGDLESFAALLAHDLRALISSARKKFSGYHDDDTPDTQRARVDGTLGHILRIVDGLLEYATTSSLAGPDHALDVGAMVRRIAEDSVAGTAISVAMDGDWPVITTAVAPLDLVFRNLIQNAVKHHDTGKGIIRLSVTTEADDLVFEIADDGPGIPQSRQHEIFDPLVTLSGGTAPTTGLGLSFVRRAAASVGGRIEVESDPSRTRGTVFRVIWPSSGRCHQDD